MSYSIGKFFYKFSILFLLAGLISCNSDNKESLEPDTPGEPSTESTRTILVYIIGDVNLWQEQWENLNRLEAGWSNDLNGNLLVYLDPSPHTPQFTTPVLLEIVPDKSSAVVSRIIKTYPEQDAVDKAVMKGVLEDAIELYPASSQGLIIASHGSGWLPAFSEPLVPPGEGEDHEIEASSLSIGRLPQTRSISGGDRFNSEININDLAELLPIKYDFILMHACLMANIETVYALKDKCKMYVASAESLPGVSLPFQTITRYLFAQPAADFLGVLEESSKYYQSLPDDQFDMLTLSAIRTDLLDNLAAATRALMVKVAADPAVFFNKLIRQAHQIDGSLYFDLKQVMQLEVLASPELMQEYANFEKALDDAVILNNNTFRTKNLGGLLSPKDYCGVTCYLPLPLTAYQELNSHYQTQYKWGEASGFSMLIGYLMPQ